MAIFVITTVRIPGDRITVRLPSLIECHMDEMNNSGFFAANCGIPVLSLWGLTHPFCGFKPFDQPIEHSLTVDRNDYPEIPTSIFGDKIPKNYESAFRSIEPKKVIEKTLEILDTAKYHHN